MVIEGIVMNNYLTFSNGISANDNVEANAINLEKKHELEGKFQDLINNPRFWENQNRIKRLEEALVLPVFDDRSMQQFYISAKDDLLAKEMKLAIEDNRPPVMPTEEAVKELAKKKYDDKQKLEQDKAKKAQEKADKKAAALKS
jgi:hypothetical protein